MAMPDKLREFLDTLSEKEAEELYDWIDTEPLSELIVQRYLATKYPSMFDVPPEFGYMINPNDKEG